MLYSKFCNKEILMIILNPSEAKISNLLFKWHGRDQVCSCSVKQRVFEGPVKVKSQLQLKFNKTQDP